MSLRFAVLGSLAKAPASGYDLLKRFDRKFNFIWWASHGAVYTELQKLEQDRLIEPSESGTRGRIEHRPTEEGLAALVEWLASPPARRPRDELTLRVRDALGPDTPMLGTGAGHDAGILAQAGVPTTMLFVRNPTGASHTPEEFAEPAASSSRCTPQSV